MIDADKNLFYLKLKQNTRGRSCFMRGYYVIIYGRKSVSRYIIIYIFNPCNCNFTHKKTEWYWKLLNIFNDFFFSSCFNFA